MTELLAMVKDKCWRSDNVLDNRNPQKACYESVREQMVIDYKTPLLFTHLKPKVAVSADKWTAYQDGARQVIMCISINSEEYPNEAIISASVVMDPTAVGATENFNNEICKVIDPKQIVAMSTDGASVYTACEKTDDWRKNQI